ncbi:MAG: mechanosensitive ion channel family protein [Gammaproteobacteria bacterium]|nr:mechanosensitive ion channel family protein [Gammaproteobacteria bacterium]NNL99259.1 mechanosensitive ion channel family protein [Gammaproteobacteria bacterium]
MSSNETLSSLYQFLTNPLATSGLRAAVLLVAGFVLARLLSRVVAHALEERLDAHQHILARRIIFYTVLGLFVTMTLRELGFSLHVLMGAAGLFTVAIGFASQTSVSNLISGMFLLAERPFRVGDVIRIGETSGEVIGIDMLSIKLRTFDNLFVRIPNEQVIKTQLTTMTRFPIRRYDLQVGVAYKEDLANVRKVLLEVADANPLCLHEPQPLLIFQGFADSALSIQFSVWALRENFLELRNTMAEDIKAAFDAAGIEIPFPHRTLYSGSVTEPFPVQVVSPPGAG